MVSVSIDSGPLEATDQLRHVPQQSWRDLMVLRRDFMHINLSHDCRCLIRFIEDAKQMFPVLGFASTEDMIRRGLDLEPAEIDIAVEWLKINPPNEPIPLAHAVKLGKHGGDRRSEKAKDQACNTSLKPGTRDHWLERLRRDGFAELADRVDSRQMSANAAALQAGYRTKLSPLEAALKLIPKLTAAERAVLCRRLEELLAA